MEAVAALLAGLGLAGAAGLNAWIPLLGVGVAGRWLGLDLGDPYDVVSTDAGLAVCAAGFAIDFVGDKIPAVDHVLHAVGTVVAPIAGAVVAAGQGGADVPPVVLLVAGALTAEGIQLGRAAARGGSTATTAGMANPVLSIVEDVGAALLVVLALLAPVVAVLVVVALGWALWRAARRVRRAIGPAQA